MQHLTMKSATTLMTSHNTEGIMASNAAGELAAAHVAGGTLPEYASAFLPSRWNDPTYLDDVKAGKFKGLQI
jgi:hypothetical protein